MQGLNTEQTMKQLVFAVKGASYCANEAAVFKQCRATPSGNLANPEFCESQAANFMQCYHDM